MKRPPTKPRLRSLLETMANSSGTQGDVCRYALERIRRLESENRKLKLDMEAVSTAEKRDRYLAEFSEITCAGCNGLGEVVRPISRYGAATRCSVCGGSGREVRQ